MFGALADRFGWTPEQVGELTVDQVKGYFQYLKDHPRMTL